MTKPNLDTWREDYYEIPSCDHLPFISSLLKQAIESMELEQITWLRQVRFINHLLERDYDNIWAEGYDLGYNQARDDLEAKKKKLIKEIK